MTATTTRSRIGVLGLVFAAGFAVVVIHLWFLMVQDHEVWARRSHENRWSFKSVPSQRGVLRDRFGRVLAQDEPTTQLTVHYARFRQRHPVGAAVHGAIRWAEQQPERAGTIYDYLDGWLGPEAAARDLLAMPAWKLRPRELPKDVAGELASAVTTVLANCSGQARSRVFAAVRKAAQEGGALAVGDALDVPRDELLAVFTRRWQALQQLDRELQAETEQRLGRPRIADDAPGLLSTLEILRRACLTDAHVTWKEDGKDVVGSKIEDVRHTFAEHVSFDVAAELRVASEHFAGIDVLPSVARRHPVVDARTLDVLLGQVTSVDRTDPRGRLLAAAAPAAEPAPAPDPKVAAEQQRAREKQARDERAFERFLARDLPSEWLEDLVPPEESATDEDRQLLQEEAKDRYTRELLLRERRGVTGMEAAFDAELMGRLGLRLVEHDAKRREQLLWSHLRVQAGEDVQITIDVDLQRLAEAAADAAWRQQLHGSEADRALVEAAIAVIDAGTGDILAYGGAPILSESARNVPGVVWLGNGSLGSLVKPFVLVEQLQCEATGRPHRAISTLEGCSGTFRYGGRELKCSHAHWDGGRDPVEALAESCNVFYFQCAIGLGDDGLARALRRFGLAEPIASDPFAACWQPGVRGIPVAPPSRESKVTLLPQRAIGYGVQASPLHVARAYAALATGWLPTLGVQTGPRPRVPLDDVVGELALVEKGLRACVQNGTASRLPLLNDLGVCGKTGTAEVSTDRENNAWFAGYLPPLGSAGTQLCICAVVYWVEDKVHGGDAAGRMVVDLLTAIQADRELNARYLLPEGGR